MILLDGAPCDREWRKIETKEYLQVNQLDNPVPNNRSPISPIPGTMYPRSSRDGSTALTTNLVPSGQTFAAFSNPVWLVRMETKVMWSTPQSLWPPLSYQYTESY